MATGTLASKEAQARDDHMNQQLRTFNDQQKIFNVPPLKAPHDRFRKSRTSEMAHEALNPPRFRFLDRLTRPTSANEMARSSFYPLDVYEVAAKLAAYNDAPDPDDVAKAAREAARQGITLSASAPAIPTQGHDNFKPCNHFGKGEPALARFERGLPPGYAGFYPRFNMPERTTGYKVGETTAPPVQYSRDRTEQLWRNRPSQGYARSPRWNARSLPEPVGVPGSLDPQYANVTC